jgi:ribosomal protein S12 methylthiotransferase
MAYLKISEGCDHVCSFCAIPGFRGKFRSRTVKDLVAESRRLAGQGVRELVLVSQDTMAYGKDLGMDDGITELLRQLAAIEDLRWVRFLYCYPHTVTDALIRLVSEEEKLCKYFDIPYQHASNAVLDRMLRGGNRGTYERQIEKIRRLNPNAGLRTSFIVGFPGETENDFREILTFMKNVEFDNVGVFLYSDEEGTGAFKLDGKFTSNGESAEKRADEGTVGNFEAKAEWHDWPQIRGLAGRHFGRVGLAPSRPD